MYLTAKQWIAIHVCYRHIFNCPTHKSDLAKWMNLSQDDTSFQEAILSLLESGNLECNEEYLWVAGHDHLLDALKEKATLTESRMKLAQRFASRISWIPMLRYIGVSGSIAAGNPTPDKNGYHKGEVDLDMYVVTSKNTLWILLIFERFYWNFKHLLGQSNLFCFNYATEDSFLEITNKCFYTATELVNMKTVLNKNTYQKILHDNEWYQLYYPSNLEPIDSKLSHSWISVLLYLPNLLCYFTFYLFKILKRRDIHQMKQMSLGYNPKVRFSLNRIANPDGGYEIPISIKFGKAFQKHFPQYYHLELMQFLFPSFQSDQSSNFEESEIVEELFTKYES